MCGVVGAMVVGLVAEHNVIHKNFDQSETGDVRALSVVSDMNICQLSVASKVSS